MRVIEIDETPLLPMLNTSYNGFAMWVNFSRHHVPSELQVNQKPSGVIGLKFVYEADYKAWAKKATPNTTVYGCEGLNFIAGFDIPAMKFHRELRDVLVWLKEEQHNLNSATVRNNYKLISAILHYKVNELFLPAQ